MTQQKQPQISVIVPAYNTAKYIAACLDSILAQTFTDFEIICINDGSTDNSLEIFNQYAKRDKRIKVIDQKNMGIVYARNNAIASARGEYIYPLDSDDMIAPMCLEVLHRIITTTDYSVVCPGGILFGRKTGYWKLAKPNRINMYCGSNGAHNSSLYPKSLWEKYGGYCKDLNRLASEDYDFWLCFIDDNKKLLRTKLPMFFYRIKPRVESRNHCDKDTSRKSKEILLARHPKTRLFRKYKKIIKPFLIISRQYKF